VRRVARANCPHLRGNPATSTATYGERRVLADGLAARTVRRVSGLRKRLTAAELAAPLALVAVALAQLWPGLAAGLAAPLSWDHGAHLGKAMLTVELLPALRGWTDLVESGVPLNTVYSVGGPLWVLLFRAPTTWLEWHQTYALAFAAFRVLVGLAPYRLARVAGASPLGAFFAGLVALADHGDHSEGGWFYDVTYGVWPMSLSMCFLFFGLADLIASRAKTSRLTAARAALLLGAALVTHQMPLVALAALVPLWLVTRWLDGARGLAGDGRAALAVTLTAGCVAGFWLVPMLAQSAWLSEHGQLYRTFTELGRGAAAGEMVLRAGPWTSVLVAIAVLRALFARGTQRFLGLAVVLMIAVSARTWLLDWEALRLLPALGKLMYPRFLMIAKPMAFVLVGMLVGELATPTLGAMRRALRSPRGLVGLGVAALLVAPFARGITQELRARIVERELDTTATSALWPHFLAYAAWERARPHAPGERVAYFHVESHLFQGAPAYTGVPAHKIGMLIAETFGNTTDSGEENVLRALGVRSIVSVGPAPGRFASRLREVRRFGPIVVNALVDAEIAPAFDPDDAARTPHVASLTRDTVEIAPNGARRVVLRRADGPGWRAEIDGRAAEIAAWAVPDTTRLRFVGVEVPAGAQRVRFHYAAWQWFDIAGVLLTLAGLLGAALLARPDIAPTRVRARLAAWRVRLTAIPAKVRAGAALAVGLAVIAALFARNAGTYAFADHLDDANYAVIAPNGAQTPCTAERPDGERGVMCPIAPWLWLGRTVQAVEGRLRSCVWAHPPPGGQTGRVRFPQAQLGARLTVGGGVGDDAQGGDGPPVVLRVRVDERELGALEAPWRARWVEQTFATTPGVHAVGFDVQAASDARRFFCFDAVSH
jgi:hypothetical protein